MDWSKQGRARIWHDGCCLLRKNCSSEFDMWFPTKINRVCPVSFVLGVLTPLVLASVTLLLTHPHGAGWLTAYAVGPEKSGPGGSIEALEIPLASPDGVFPDRTARLESPKWVFEDCSESRLARFFSSCDLRPVERRMLLDERYWSIASNCIVISPPEQLIWSLSPRSRQQIYSVLSKNPANFPQCYPFRFPLQGFNQKFKDSGLPVQQVQRILALTYTNSDFLCFTDLQAVKAVLRTNEFQELIEILYELPTYMLRLRINPDSDIEAMIKYWGKGGREKMISPMLNALTKVPGGTVFNISYLLPPFARLRLYTYPYTWNDPTAARQDCFFTSMNFFNETPDTNFFDGVYTAKVLHSDYSQIRDAPTFGDIVTLVNATGQVFHACVYIVDDFVFTKNGVNPEQPWVLMKISDMLMIYYPNDKSGHIEFLRRKNLA